MLNNDGKSYNKIVGMLGEKVAREYLKKHGHKILEKNYKRKSFEIDIISLDKEKNIHFVEVKTRKNEKFGHGSDAVTAQKLHKIKRGVMWYINTHNPDAGVYIDVIEVYGSITPFGFKTSSINYIENVVD